MDQTFEYQSVPYGYKHCFNNECVRRENCLHHLVAKHSNSRYPALTIVNPHCIPEDTAKCPFFKSSQPIQIAWGIKTIFDSVPYKNAKVMRMRVISYFGRTHYYRIYNQERGLTPQDQAYIRQVFRENGVPEPTFERYTSEYNFD